MRGGWSSKTTSDSSTKPAFRKPKEISIELKERLERAGAHMVKLK
jgi:hypothetical protein